MSLSKSVLEMLLEYSTDPGRSGEEKGDTLYRRVIRAKNRAKRFLTNAKFAQRDDARDRHDTAVNARKEKREKRTKLLPDGVRSFTLGKSSQSESPSAKEARDKAREGKQLIVRPTSNTSLARTSSSGGSKKRRISGKMLALGGAAGAGAVGAALLKKHLSKKADAPTPTPPSGGGHGTGALAALAAAKDSIKQKIAEHPHAAMGAAAAGLGAGALAAGYKAYKSRKNKK